MQMIRKDHHRIHSKGALSPHGSKGLAQHLNGGLGSQQGSPMIRHHRKEIGTTGDPGTSVFHGWLVVGLRFANPTYTTNPTLTTGRKRGGERFETLHQRLKAR